MKKFGNLKLYNNRPTIIAEAGVNHGCNLKLAKNYISQAKKSGADAIKFQTYKAETIAHKDSPAYWDTTKEKTVNQHLLFKKFDKFEYGDYKKLYLYSKKEKIEFMTSLFDVDAVDIYSPILSIFKISSSDINNIPLLRKIGKKKKYTIISTGGSKLSEIKNALKYLNLPPNKVCIMHCVLNYPTKDENAELEKITILKKNFPKNLIGYSDHTIPTDNLITLKIAFDLGAEIVEKHFTHNKNLSGNDHYHSMNSKNLINFHNLINKIDTIKKVNKDSLKNQKKSRIFARRSIYVSKDIKKGEILSDKNLIALRPATGISISKWDQICKKKAKKNILKNKKLSFSDFC
jgi:sialic acid synthase SpsE